MRHVLANTTFIIGFLLLIAFSHGMAQFRSDTSALGSWQGILDAGGTKLRIVFHVMKIDSSQFSATLDSPDQGATGIPVSKVSIMDDSIIFVVAVVGGRYEGKLSGENNSIAGVWKQMGAVLSLKLDKSKSIIEINRSQEPKPPFSYRAEDVLYENTAEGVKLAGTLTLPHSGGPFPVALLITGSGAQDRNEALFGHKPFLVIADYLTKRGIAVLRVDDRGVGGSTGMTSNSTSANFVTDVIAGIQFLKKRTDIDKNKIGLIGHSEGGMIAPMAAAQSNDIAFIVMLSGPGLRGDEIIEQQVASIEHANGVPADKIKKDVEFRKKLHALLKSGKDSSAIAADVRDYLNSTVSQWGAEFQKSGTDPEKSINDQMKTLLSPWFRYFLSYDPRPALIEVRCPVLAMGGSLDMQVEAETNLKEIGDVLKKSGNKDYTTKFLPGLNHLFQHAKTGSPGEYGQIEETIAPEALKILGDWITERVSK